MKINKTGNKRGRPRKNPLAPVEAHMSKLKRGPKSKAVKQYEFDPNYARNSFDVTFNRSNSEGSENLYENDDHVDRGSPIGPIQRNLKLVDNNPAGYDGLLNKIKEEKSQNNMPSFYPRKQSLENPFDKFFGQIPQNLDYVHDNNRSRRISSAMSPYLIPSNGPQMHSPNVFRGFNKNISKDDKIKASEVDPTQKRLNEIIAQSFNNWNNKPRRKETDDVDLFAGETTLLGIMNNAAKGSTSKKLGNQFNFLAPNSIMSPEYKPRTFSVNSSGCWGATPIAFDDSKNRFNWEENLINKDDKTPKFNSNKSRKNSHVQNESKNKILKGLEAENAGKPAYPPRKNTIIDQATSEAFKLSLK